MSAPHLFDVLAERDEWLGYGYLGERQNVLEAAATGGLPAALTDRVAAADAFLIEHAARLGWSTDRLFEWANSKAGRWFADDVFGCDRSPAEAAAKDYNGLCPAG
jgi:hypothetical protein